MTPPSQRSHTKALPSSTEDVVALGDDAIPFLQEKAVKGAECVGAQDPLLVLHWNDAALGTRSLSSLSFPLRAFRPWLLIACLCFAYHILAYSGSYCVQRCVHESGHPRDFSAPSAASAEPHESGRGFPVFVPRARRPPGRAARGDAAASMDASRGSQPCRYGRRCAFLCGGERRQTCTWCRRFQDARTRLCL